MTPEEPINFDFTPVQPEVSAPEGTVPDEATATRAAAHDAARDGGDACTSTAGAPLPAAGAVDGTDTAHGASVAHGAGDAPPASTTTMANAAPHSGHAALENGAVPVPPKGPSGAIRGTPAGAVRVRAQTVAPRPRTSPRQRLLYGILAALVSVFVAIGIIAAFRLMDPGAGR